MARTDPTPLFPLLRKLQLWQPFNPTEQDAVLTLPHVIQKLPAGAHIVREGEQARQCCLLISGFACRYKIAGNGARSIHSFHMAGDFVDLQNALLGDADHSVQTLSSVRVAMIARADLLRLADTHPRIGFAMWYDTLVDGSVFREWITNIARRDAQTRIAHLLCEIGLRLEASGSGERDSFELPVTQDQLADATGLTSVHVNRTLMDLERQGLFTRTLRYVAVPDWQRLSHVGDFDPAYLHLPQSGPAVPENGGSNGRVDQARQERV